MKVYLITTGSLFGLLALMHMWRIVAQWPRLLHDSGEIVEAGIGVVALALCLWAWRLLRTPARA
jgi:hypothetical protein